MLHQRIYTNRAQLWRKLLGCLVLCPCFLFSTFFLSKNALCGHAYARFYFPKKKYCCMGETKLRNITTHLRTKKKFYKYIDVVVQKTDPSSVHSQQIQINPVDYGWRSYQHFEKPTTPPPPKIWSNAALVSCILVIIIDTNQSSHHVSLLLLLIVSKYTYSSKLKNSAL